MSLYTSSIGELYEHLVKTEKDVGASYREFRATADMFGVAWLRRMALRPEATEIES